MDENKNFEQKVENLEEEVKEVEEELAGEAAEEKGILEQAGDALKDLKDKVSAVEVNDGVTIGDYAESFGNKVGEVFSTASSKVKAFAEDPKTVEAVNKAKENVGKAAEAVKGKISEVVASFKKEEEAEEAEECCCHHEEGEECCCHEEGEECCCEKAEEEKKLEDEVKKVANAVTDKAKEVKDAASAKYQEFIHDENVRKTVRNAKNFLTSLAEKTVSGVKNLFEPEKAEEEGEKEE